MKNFKLPMVVALLVASGLVLGACSHTLTSEETSTASPSTLETMPALEESGTSAATSQMVDETDTTATSDYTMDMKNFAFAPNTLKAKAGQTLKIKMTNSQGFHDFVAEDLNVKTKMIKEGEEMMVEVKIPTDASGKTFEFYCSIGNHRQQGMTGTIVVE